MGQKQKSIIIVILFLVSICFLLKDTPNLLQYSAEKYMIYAANMEEPLVENIVNPAVFSFIAGN